MDTCSITKKGKSSGADSSSHCDLFIFSVLLLLLLAFKKQSKVVKDEKNISTTNGNDETTP
jgi:hypothetical protein